MADYDIGAAFQAIEDELIASMIRNMDRHRAWEDDEGIQWSMWQAEQLKALEKYKRANQKKYGRQFENINGQIGEILYKARQTGNMQQEIRILNAIMERFTSSVLSGIEQANALGLHGDTLNTCHCSYIYTDELLPDSGAGKGPYSQNCWAFGMAQLFSSVSPDMTEEFELPYITRMAEAFGMIYYGCCDRLDDRLDIIKRIPHLKKVSCSPWSHVEAFAEKIGPSLVMSNKPNPAYVATDDFDCDLVRQDLQRTYDAAKRNHVNLEFILKDISTVRHEPERLRQWAEIAMEVVCQ